MNDHLIFSRLSNNLYLFGQKYLSRIFHLKFVEEK